MKSNQLGYKVAKIAPLLVTLLFGFTSLGHATDLVKTNDGRGYVITKTLDELKQEANAGDGYLSTATDNEHGNHMQATAFVKYATGLGMTSLWRAGDPVTKQGMQEGTAIGVFSADGRYGNSKNNFAAIFEKYTLNPQGDVTGIQVIEQYNKAVAGRLHENIYYFKDTPGHHDTNPLHIADNFSLITLSAK